MTDRDHLTLDPRLPDLPMLELAEDLGRRYGGLEVRVSAVYNPDGQAVAGSFRRPGAHGGAEICIDPSIGDAVATWVHELAHAVDRLDGRCTGYHGRARVRAENFADVLGAYLVDAQPATVAEAQWHAVGARRAVRAIAETLGPGQRVGDFVIRQRLGLPEVDGGAVAA